MENPVVDQLPEVHSLPDGFVEGSAEPLDPSTPTLEQEKPLTDYKEEKLVEPNLRTNVVVNDLESSESKADENSGRLNDLHVAFPENDISDGSQALGEVPSEVGLHCSDITSVAAEGVDSASGYGERESEEVLSGSSCKGEQEKGQSSEKSMAGSSDTQAANVKAMLSSETIEKHRKVEAPEAKRKNAKRAFKSEKEFLEFTLKYQQVLAERDQAIAVRDKLESLCRGLQRQNKMLMDECKRVSTEGQILRLDLSTKFQDAIKEVSNKLEEQKVESLLQLKDNEMLRSKLKQFSEQYTLSEQQYAQKLKQKTLELQIADLKNQQHEEKLIQEQAQMKRYAEQVTQLLATEKNLRMQLTADGEKFQQFQEALLKSNEVFETFKQEIEKMTKSIKELNKENAFLKSKCEKSDITLIELVEEREHLKKRLEKTRNQKEKLESLCRSLLQEERKQSPADRNSSDAVAI